MMRVDQKLQNLIFPHTCILCGTLLDKDDDRGYPLCAACENSLPDPPDKRCLCCGRPLISEIERCMVCRQHTFAFDRLIPLYPYQDEKSGALVRAFKKGKRYSLAQFWVGKLENVLKHEYEALGIVPVPPRPEKIIKGEHDQVEILASLLELRGFTIARILAREESQQQKKLNRSMRLESARKAYRIQEPFTNRAPQRIILLDDVFTTGATLDTCARILKDNGATWVGAVVLAYD